MEITKKDFEEYEKVRKSGVTNMYMITTVCNLSGLNTLQVKEIMKNYGDLNKKYPEVRGL